MTPSNLGPSQLLWKSTWRFSGIPALPRIYGKPRVPDAGRSERVESCYLQLLLPEHIRPRSVEDVVGQLGLAVNVDRRGGFAGQEAVVDLSGTLRELGGKKRHKRKD